jgi:hypothetical protein
LAKFAKESIEIKSKIVSVCSFKNIFVSDAADGHQYEYVPQLENLLQGFLVHPAAVHSRKNSYFTNPAKHCLSLYFSAMKGGPKN